jgi:hypothetical protein
MTNKYMKYERKPQKKNQELHPIWRGIGCLLFVIVPVLSYAITVLIIPAIQATGIFPAVIYQRIRFPDWAYETIFISGIARFITNIDYFWATLIFFVVVLLVLAGVFSIIYSAVYQAVGPARYTAVDAPPAPRSGKQYKR